MKNEILEKLDLRFEKKNEKELWLTDLNSLRMLIGILGVMLPFLLLASEYIFTGVFKPLSSISHYYYTRSGIFFIVIVSLLAIFLLVYKGPKFVDYALSSLAGVSAFILLFFPTTNLYEAVCFEPGSSQQCYTQSINYMATDTIYAGAHFTAAGIFLGSLALMSLFLFTKSGGGPKTKRKVLRNRFYYLFGVIMILAMIVIGLRQVGMEKFDAFYDNHQLTFWMESVAVVAFGLSWLVKSECILKDEKNHYVGK